MTAIPAHVDLLIVGGGPVGGALALALQDSGRSVAVIEARAEPVGDARALAVAEAAAQRLAEMGAWPAAAASPIRRVHVSQQGAFGRVLLDRHDLKLDALGHVMPYAALAGAIHRRLQTVVPHYLPGTSVTGLRTLDGYAVATVERAGETSLITARLVVLAEGGRLFEAAGLERIERDYAQTALVAEIHCDRDHDGMAFERFASDGPIALLPLLPDRAGTARGRFAVVWTRPRHDPLAVATLDDAAFLAALQERLGDRAGRLLTVGPRQAFPLRLRWARRPYGRRVAVVGNAAQTLHPVAGQGFNLGFRDALTLARLVRASSREQLGEPAMLARYAELRRLDSGATVGFTDGLIRLFGIDRPALRHARAAGFIALDNLPPLRRLFAERMVFGSP
ncbi:FAD-dependent monooxygenase [Chitinimonas lacunae]|uniref:FAD-dependent monooxygenase n=1 Tax=Chitinimonas lacunae TaxID=1963018 RepID=A0ABV8MVQ7_9NEIS